MDTIFFALFFFVAGLAVGWLFLPMPAWVWRFYDHYTKP